MATTKLVPIFEKELVTLCANNEVKYLNLVYSTKDSREGYQLRVKCIDHRNEYLLCAHNTKEPRLWANLDRAVKHFREKYFYKGRVFLDI